MVHVWRLHRPDSKPDEHGRGKPEIGEMRCEQAGEDSMMSFDKSDKERRALGDARGGAPVVGGGMAAARKRIVKALGEFRDLFDAFERAGFQLYAVGGCVRDWVLGCVPKDIDFTTDALPSETKAVLSSNHYPVIPVGEVFGTIATNIDKKTYEITTFRVKESYTRGSRHPVVCYGRDLSRDLERRDLTINAMAASSLGEIIDPFDGVGDLLRRVLRVPRSSYERSIDIFSDDPLRILRLARFKARLGFDVDGDAQDAARDMAGSVLSVSRERWHSEVDGLLAAAHPEAGLSWLDEVGVLPLLIPEIRLLQRAYVVHESLVPGTAQNSDVDLWSRILSTLPSIPPADDLRWCFILGEIGYGVCGRGSWADRVSTMIAREICQRFKFPTSRVDSIERKLVSIPAPEPTYRMARELAQAIGEDLPVWMSFQRCKCATFSAPLFERESAILAAWNDALLPYIERPALAPIRLPKDLSKKLIEAFGVSGKTLGLYLSHCRDAVLDQVIAETSPSEDFVDFCRAHDIDVDKN